MRLRFTTSIAGAHYSFKPGDETEWPNEAEARRFIEAGIAVPVRSIPIETSDDRRGASESADAPPVVEHAAQPPAPAAEEADAEEQPPSGGKKSGGKKSGGKTSG